MATKIRTPEELRKIGENEKSLAGQYELANDITLPSDGGFTPIGTSSKRFKGVFDGKNFTIRNLRVSAESASGVGLFGYCMGAAIRNLNVEGHVTAKGSQFAGGIAGHFSAGGNSGSEINNCRFTGTVEAMNYVGGIAGNVEDGRIINCDAEAAVTGIFCVGGIAGAIACQDGRGEITKCCHTGTVAGLDESEQTDTREYAGGITGYIVSPESADAASGKPIIHECCHIGDITGFSLNTGGIAGCLDKNAVISRCYSVCDITLSKRGGVKDCASGGIAGGAVLGVIIDSAALCLSISTSTPEQAYPVCHTEKNGRVTNCCAWSGMMIYNTDDAGDRPVYASEGVALKDAYELEYNRDFFAGQLNWDFTDTWCMLSTGYPFPVHKRNMDNRARIAVYPADFRLSARFYRGSGTPAEPYLIFTKEQLDMVRNGADKHYRLMNDLDLSGFGGRWEAICREGKPFTGLFDGNGHEITGLLCEQGDLPNAGLFGVIGRGGAVYGLKLRGRVSAGSNSGLFAGRNCGAIGNCVADGIVNGKDASGIIAGVNDGGLISDCRVTHLCAVYGANGVGGIAGENCGVIRRCYVLGMVSGQSSVGGITGVNYSLGLTIMVELCVAVCRALIAKNAERRGRVIGEYFEAGDESQKNYAHAAMPGGTGNKRDGIGKTMPELLDKALWEDKDFWGAFGRPETGSYWVWGDEFPVMSYENDAS